MSVISVTKLSAREATETKANKSYVDEYVVITDNPLDDPPFILASALLPQRGDTYNTERSTILGAVVKSVRLSHLDRDPVKWMARVEYGTADQGQPDDEDVPPDRTPRLGVRFEKTPHVLEHDAQDSTTPVVNSARQPFTNPPVMVTKTDTVVTVSRFLDSLSLSSIMSYNDVINSTGFAGATSGQLRLNFSDAREVYEEGATYWNVTLDLAFRSTGWNPISVLDRGYVENAQGDRVFGLLDGSGNLSTNSTFLNFNGYTSVDFKTVTELDGVEGLLS